MNASFNIRDEYQRKKIAENLKTLLDASIDISPVVIDGAWGTGKTEFSLKLKNYLSSEITDSFIIYLDAFEEDHCDDPLLSITAAIAKNLPKKKKESFVKAAIPAVKFGAKTALKAGVAWVVRENATTVISDFESEIKDATNSLIDNTIEKLLDEHIHAEENIRNLRLKIEEIAQKNKIVIIIDELDRCRPNFAINLLEKIKHIFNVHNVSFILIANIDQLMASINHVYGSAVNSRSYLDKFIKFTVSFPDTFDDEYNQSIHTSLVHWNTLLEVNVELTKSLGSFSEQIKELITAKPLSLREVESLFRHFEIYQKLSGNSINADKSLISNIVKMIGVYIYCFAQNKSLSKLSTDQLIDTILKTLDITHILVDESNIHRTPQYQVALYGLMEEANLNIPGIYQNNHRSRELLSDYYHNMTQQDYYSFLNEKTLKNTIKIFSLT